MKTGSKMTRASFGPELNDRLRKIYELRRKPRDLHDFTELRVVSMGDRGADAVNYLRTRFLSG